MTIKVKVSEVVQQMDLPGPGFTTYMNRHTGEFVTLSAEETQELESEDRDSMPEWLREMSPGDFVALPDSLDTHELAIMRDFAGAVSAAEASERLRNALDGEGAFRHFRDQVHDLGLVEQWDRARGAAFEQIAANWLEENGIPRGEADGS